MDWRLVLAWILPSGLMVSYLYLWFNPRAVTSWVAPYRASVRNDWQIKTPADIELLIGQAQLGQQDVDPQASEGAIRRIATTLTSKGVRILISDNVRQHAAGEWDPSYREVRIRPSTLSMGTAILAEALAHEAAHVAQSCRAGGLSKKSEPMGIPVDSAKTFEEQLSSPLYAGPPAERAIELEAFTVGKQPDWAHVLVDHFCKS